MREVQQSGTRLLLSSSDRPFESLPVHLPAMEGHRGREGSVPGVRGECVKQSMQSMNYLVDLCCTILQADGGLFFCRHVCHNDCLVLEAAPPPSKAERRMPSTRLRGQWCFCGCHAVRWGAREEGWQGGLALRIAPYLLRCFRSGPARHLHGHNFGPPVFRAHLALAL